MNLGMYCDILSGQTSVVHAQDDSLAGNIRLASRFEDDVVAQQTGDGPKRKDKHLIQSDVLN